MGPLKPFEMGSGFLYKSLRFVVPGNQIEDVYKRQVQFLLYGFLQSQQAALSQPAVQKGKDADKGDLTDEAFLNALVVKNTKRLIEHLLIKGALLQRIGMSLVDGLFCALTFPPFKQVRMVWPSI